MQKLKYGYCIGEPTFEKVDKAVMMAEVNKEMKSRLEHASKMMKLKKEDPFDTMYWIDYVMEVGTQHLVPKDTISLSYFQLLELDIHLALYLILLALILIPFFVLRMCCKCLCGKKKQSA
mmetsp:Transcript_6429/g.5735  ORF Transcript_6429/g.5735 Transcript_6429/m.5735 type:complete len:120 (-) Transcript_6429:20-379(-)